METYHKIQTTYLRDPGNNYKTLLEGEWAKPEFGILKDIEWTWTEKIDGTNIRIMWENGVVRFGGKTDRAQIPVHLLNVLQDTFTSELMEERFGDDSVCLYGEGYGAKIQKGGNYIPDRSDFILFDCKVGKWWLKREAIESISNELGIGVVPIIGIGKLEEAIELVRGGFVSTISHNRNYIAEGLIMKPCVELFNRSGQRVVTKIKHKDFRKK